LSITSLFFGVSLLDIEWFDGDPVALNPVPRSIFSARIIEMMGGGELVLQKAVDALKKGVDLCKNPDTVELGKMEIQFAAKLTTYHYYVC
jgi:hypothetical protein